MLDTLILRDQVTTSQLILVLAHGQQHLHVEPSCMVDFGVGGPKRSCGAVVVFSARDDEAELDVAGVCVDHLSRALGQGALRRLISRQ